MWQRKNINSGIAKNVAKTNIAGDLKKNFQHHSPFRNNECLGIDLSREKVAPKRRHGPVDSDYLSIFRMTADDHYLRIVCGVTEEGSILPGRTAVSEPTSNARADDAVDAPSETLSQGNTASGTLTASQVLGTQWRHETNRGSLKSGRELLVGEDATETGTRSIARSLPMESLSRLSGNDVRMSKGTCTRNPCSQYPFQDKISAFLLRIEFAQKSRSARIHRETKERRQIEFSLQDTKAKNSKRALGDCDRLKMVEKIGGIERRYAIKQELATRVMADVAMSREEGKRRLAENKPMRRSRGNPESQPKFLVSMEERRKERMARRNIIQERKKMANEEKRREVRLRESERISAETAAAREWQKMVKEKIRLEKQRAEAIARRKEEFREFAALARDHHRRSVLVRAWNAWRTAVTQSLDRIRWAEGHRERALKAKAFARWRGRSRDANAAREDRADRFYKTHLRKYIFKGWRKAVAQRRQDYQVAADWNDFNLLERHFRIWLDFTLKERIKYVASKKMAESRYERKLKAKYMRILRRYPKLKKLDVAMEKRKFSWRRIIRQILPDYQPSLTEVLDFD